MVITSVDYSYYLVITFIYLLGLTAKVFRTYNASITLQKQLDELTEDSMTVPEKLLAYNRANRAVAILCNHQRAVPKTHDKSMENLREKIRAKRDQIKEVNRELKVQLITLLIALDDLLMKFNCRILRKVLLRDQ